MAQLLILKSIVFNKFKEFLKHELQQKLQPKQFPNNPTLPPKLQLNPNAKGLLLKYALVNQLKKPRNDDNCKFFKFLLISKDYLMASQEHRVYSLSFDMDLESIMSRNENNSYLSHSSYHSNFSLYIQPFNLASDDYIRLQLCKNLKNPQELKQLIKLLQPPNVYFNFYELMNKKAFNQCVKLMGFVEAHISLSFNGIFHESFQLQKLFQKFHSKILRLECSQWFLVGLRSGTPALNFTRLYLDEKDKCAYLNVQLKNGQTKKFNIRLINDFNDVELMKNQFKNFQLSM